MVKSVVRRFTELQARSQYFVCVCVCVCVCGGGGGGGVRQRPKWTRPSQ